MVRLTSGLLVTRRVVAVFVVRGTVVGQCQRGGRPQTSSIAESARGGDDASSPSDSCRVSRRATWCLCERLCGGCLARILLFRWIGRRKGPGRRRCWCCARRCDPRRGGRYWKLPRLWHCQRILNS